MDDAFVLLHTADWHLGHSLYGTSQKEDHNLFLDWLLETIKKESADALLIAGDIFDQASPPSYARRQYFDFLLAAKKIGLKQIFILAGNHDSPSDLAAPKNLLQELFPIHYCYRLYKSNSFVFIIFYYEIFNFSSRLSRISILQITDISGKLYNSHLQP